MIKNIKIKNFRCFNDLKVSGFEKINLISGKNNVGKTALLEALFINTAPRPETIIFLRHVRREQLSFSKSLPERTWNNFFFRQNKSNEIVIEAKLENESSKIVEIYVDESIKDFSDEIDEQNSDNEIQENIISLFSGSESVQSVMHLKTRINHGETFETLIISSTKGLLARDIKIPDIKNAFFIPSFLRVSSRELAMEFDKARLNEKNHEVLRAFQAIDSSIVEVESFSIGEPTVYLKREGESRLPLSLFGDAINRIADIILRLVNNENSILLIDEIENGIHHSSQVYFWTILYKLANDLNVQIFATTHSLEMTEAFIKAGSEYQNTAAHFELTRQIKTNRIVAIRRDLDTLDYGISHNKEVRGE
ncbi:ATPase AAA-type core domain-containing protein [Nostoc sp. DSM 114161]|uniref:AAA family ATPase n=1 Tax=Nostoc sp. DSM 114161 TaxID=3440143 RepID=UPI004045BDAC